MSDPFSSRGPEEVALERAPLVRVIAQVRFPPIASVARLDFIGPFQEAIRSQFPILRPEHANALVLGPAGVAAGNTTVWRFHDKPEKWRVSLAPEFVALEALTYTSRDDFFERFAGILRALEITTKPGTSDRLGVRYVNRVRPPELEQLSKLVRSEVLGIAATHFSASLGHSICESVFVVGDAQLSTRWGRLPPGTTTDPTAVDPIEEPSWVLDLDMFRAAQRDFDVTELIERGRRFAKTIHDFFRWCVTPEFLGVYGEKR